MIQQIKNFFETRRITAENKLLEQKAIGKLLQEASDLVTERPDEGGYVKVSQVTDWEKGHLEPNQLEMIRQARLFYRWNENGRVAIQTLVNYIMGRGVQITPKSKDKKIWYVWREFWTASRNKMALRQFEIATRIFRDGEFLLELFDEDEDGNKTGKTSIRFIDPLLLKNPDPVSGGQYEYDKINTRNGIECDPDDVEHPIRYWVQSRTDSQKWRSIKAENVLHGKVFADSDQRRGETFLQPVMSLIKQHEEWLRNRIILNKMRTAIVLIKKITGTPTQVQQIADNWKDAKTGRSGDAKKANVRGGTVLLAGPGVDYKMESPNINATDAKEDGRHIKTSIAAGTNLPEYVFGDASNANYASSMVAESPMVKAIQYWQMVLEFYYQQLYKMVIQRAVDAGFIAPPNDEEFLRRINGSSELKEQERDATRPPEEDGEGEEEMEPGQFTIPSETFFGADLQWPEIIHREPKQHTESLQIARNAGWIADSTAAAALGFDYDEEVRKQKMIEEGARENGNPLVGMPAGMGDEGDLDAELDSVLNSMTPEEKKAILQKTDPKEIANLVLAKIGSNGGQQNANSQTE